MIESMSTGQPDNLGLLQRMRSEPRWMALWAAMFGFMLDAMDVLLYVFALPETRRVEIQDRSR